MFQRIALFVALLFVAAPALAAGGAQDRRGRLQKALDSVADGEAARKSSTPR
jgi:hypothetical protein